MKCCNLLLYTFLGFFLCYCHPKAKSPDNEADTVDTENILNKLQASATDWNNGNLDGFVSLYDRSATFMTSTGLIGVDTLQAHYQKKYFNGTHPEQQLSFNELQVKALGKNYALVTGKFMLTGAGKPEQSGHFSLIFGLTNVGWKILHDHSS